MLQGLARDGHTRSPGQHGGERQLVPCSWSAGSGLREGAPECPRGHLRRRGFSPQMRSKEASECTHRLVHAHARRHRRTHLRTHSWGHCSGSSRPLAGEMGTDLSAGHPETPPPGQGACGPHLTQAHSQGSAGCSHTCRPRSPPLAGREQSQCDPAIQPTGCNERWPLHTEAPELEDARPKPPGCEHQLGAAGAEGRLTRKVG